MAKKRSYTLRRRAESRDQTRKRIVEAAMHLHEEIGPRATTISAIAERAGVQRLTVYRHFPDEESVFRACSSHWLSLNPPPDPTNWSRIADRMERVRTALEAYYRYYRRTEGMWGAATRDEPLVPALRKPMEEFRDHLRTVADGLIEPFGPNPGKAVTASIGHALAFGTWASLKEQGLNDAEIAALACVWVEAAGRADI